MGEEDARADQPVIRSIQQRDSDLVTGIVPDASHQVVQTKIRIDHAWRRCAIGHVVVALLGRVRAGTLGQLSRRSSQMRAVLGIGLATPLLTHDRIPRSYLSRCAQSQTLVADAHRRI